MPIIEQKTVRFVTDEIPGIDFIEYIDACCQFPFRPFDTGWDVHEVDAFKGVDTCFDILSDDQQDMVWQLAEQHQAKAHEND